MDVSTNTSAGGGFTPRNGIVGTPIHRVDLRLQKHIAMNGHAGVDGIVEVFDLHGHPKASRVYAWGHETESPERPKRHVTVLHIHPVTSPVLAVRAAIAQEFRNLGTAEES